MTEGTTEAVSANTLLRSLLLRARILLQWRARSSPHSLSHGVRWKLVLEEMTVSLRHLAELEASGKLLVSGGKERNGEELAGGVVDESRGGKRDYPSCSQEWSATRREARKAEKLTRRVHPRGRRADLGRHVGLDETGKYHGLCVCVKLDFIRDHARAGYSRFPR